MHVVDFYWRINVAPLAAHLEAENVEFMQFAFRWMNCLLMREISVQNTIRMWDTYLVSTCYLRVLLGASARLIITRAGGGHGRVLAIPPIRVLCVSRPME